MHILILEDSLDRIETFRNKLKNHDLCICDNVLDAKVAIDCKDFDMFFLDHDLSLDNSDEYNTGYQFAKYMHYKGITSRVIIHSMNVVGSHKMKDMLPHAEICPFSNLFREET